MAKKGIKIKDLAVELGLTSRQLIDRCRAEGLFVQNSITRLGPDKERLVRSWFEGDEASRNGKDNTEKPRA